MNAGRPTGNCCGPIVGTVVGIVVTTLIAG